MRKQRRIVDITCEYMKEKGIDRLAWYNYDDLNEIANRANLSGTPLTICKTVMTNVLKSGDSRIKPIVDTGVHKSNKGKRAFKLK